MHSQKNNKQINKKFDVFTILSLIISDSSSSEAVFVVK